MQDEKLKQARIILLRLLAASPKTKQELAKKLQQKGFSAEIANSALAELERNGLLSDKAFAQNLVSRFTSGQPSGSKKIRFELKRRGISPDIQNEILAGMDPEEEFKRAEEVAQLRWNKLKNVEPRSRRKRVFDFLIRRGFEFQMARDTMEKLALSEPEDIES